MIKRIELTNFMSHVHTVIEPAAGLTVLVGPNNCGKSAVVAALQVVCHNDPSTYVRRHGEKECRVKLETDDGHVIEWRRKAAPSYEIDGQLFDRLRKGGLPDELHQALRLPKVEGGGDANFDIHFGSQKSPTFLLGEPDTVKARFFAASSDASRLVAMQKRHKDKLAQKQGEKNRLEAESKQLTAELEALLPTVELDHRLIAADRHHGDLVRTAAWLEKAGNAEHALRLQQQSAARHQAQASALAPLVGPPQLAQIEPLVKAIDGLHRADEGRQLAAERAEKLAALPQPPILHDVARLASTIDWAVALSTAARRGEEEKRTLAPLSQPPKLLDEQGLARLVAALLAAEQEVARYAAAANAMQAVQSLPQSLETQAVDVKPLADSLARLEQAASLARECEAKLKITEDELVVAAAALRELAATDVCPTCGAPLDADRLLERAASGLRGHAHG